MASSLGGRSGERKIRLGSITFTAEVIFDPHRLRPSGQRALAARIGGRIKDGAVCLGTDKAAALDSIQNQDYSLVAFVRNDVDPDEASGTLQLYPWCVGNTKPQLWIGDLCRITAGPKPERSPIEAIIRLFEEIARESGIFELYLMVENKSPEKNILPNIYRKYGFNVVEDCTLETDDSIVMRKAIGSGDQSSRH